MNLVCYLPGGNAVGMDVMRRCAACSSGLNISMLGELERLADLLIRPRMQDMVLLIVLPTRADLSSLLSLRHLLQGIPLVLCLPDDDPQTLAQAHRMLPRYAIPLGSIEDPETMVAVIFKIIAKYGQPAETDPEGANDAEPTTSRQG